MQEINTEKQLKAKMGLLGIALSLKNYGFKVYRQPEDWLSARLEKKVAGMEINIQIIDGKARAKVDGIMSINGKRGSKTN